MPVGPKNATRRSQTTQQHKQHKQQQQQHPVCVCIPSPSRFDSHRSVLYCRSMTTVVAGYETCPSWATAFGYLGASSCMILSSWGAAWGTWRAGMGVCQMGIDHPKGVIKNIVPIVMAGVLGIYGLIVSVIITQSISAPGGDMSNTYSLYNGYTHFAAGLCCGLSALAAGGTIGIIGDAGVRAFGVKAERGRRWYWDANGDDAGADGEFGAVGAAEAANKLYVGMLIMLIFSEALALYGLIVALILSQHSYSCA